MSKEKQQDAFLSGYFLGAGSGILLGIVIGFYFM
jgi:ABC-type nitrate/sulfonate/bicarbonate transport system permease component